VALLALLTAGLLQILSNLANDYGDAVKGSDKEDRIGPLRGMQKGMITQAQMKRALVVTVVLIAIAGCSLIAVACEQPSDVVGFLVLGGLSIVAAITYTVGTKPYGYLGLGDISVLVFFGWLSVAGTYYLQTHAFDSIVMLPATACGLLATAVLNINNLRDIESDRANGKNTLAVRLGPQNARYYHVALLIGAVACFALFTLLNLHSPWGWLFCPGYPVTGAPRPARVTRSNAGRHAPDAGTYGQSGAVGQCVVRDWRGAQLAIELMILPTGRIKGYTGYSSGKQT
jgi:1,4-dihydroxy-2-naphthoate polyprenyltransferase